MTREWTKQQEFVAEDLAMRYESVRVSIRPDGIVVLDGLVDGVPVESVAVNPVGDRLPADAYRTP